MDALLSMKDSIDLLGSPNKYFNQIKSIVSVILAMALTYINDPNANPSIKQAVNNEINLNYPEIDKIMKKYNEEDNDPEMINDADKLVGLTSRIYQLIQSELPEGTTNNSLFNGLVSKA